MKDLILLVAFLLAVNLSVLANPTPQRGPPTGLPPPNPTATITYANGGGSAYISAEGDYLAVINQCRGLDGTRGLEYVNVYTKYPNTDRRAYKLRLFPEWGCKGTPQAEVDFFYNEGQPLKDASGAVIIPKSVTFVPA